MLKLAEQHFDSVIIDAPPVTGFAETLYIASLAEATVLVTDEKRMHRKRTLKAIEQLRRIKQNLVGFIIVRSEQEALDERYYKRYRKPRPMPNVAVNSQNDLFQHGVRVKRKGLNLASAA
jgi:Mrp family chromosome partitioning ATPase